jgi:hypothetical protein
MTTKQKTSPKPSPAGASPAAPRLDIYAHAIRRAKELGAQQIIALAPPDPMRLVDVRGRFWVQLVQSAEANEELAGFVGMSTPKRGLVLRDHNFDARHWERQIDGPTVVLAFSDNLNVLTSAYAALCAGALRAFVLCSPDMARAASLDTVASLGFSDSDALLLEVVDAA